MLLLDRSEVEGMRVLWTKGTRIVLDSTDDPYTDLRPGSVGTISGVDDAGTVHVNWDNGSSMGLIPYHDHWHKEG